MAGIRANPRLSRSALSCAPDFLRRLGSGSSITRKFVSQLPKISFLILH